MKKICITGGTGFIGSHIVDYFKEKNENIECITRNQADLRNLSELKEAFKGAQCVIHNAAKASDWGSYKDFYENNVIGTLNVMKACLHNNIKKIIMTGTCSVYGEENNLSIKDEESALNSHYPYFMDKVFPCRMNFYRDSKKEARGAAIAFAKKHNIDLTILDPVWVFGEREFNTGFYEYLKTARMKIPFIMGSKKNKFHVIYARDLAKAYYLAYQKNLKGIHTFIIGREKADYMDRIYTLFCKEAGFNKPKNICKLFVYPVGFFMEIGYTILNIGKPPMLTRGRVNMFYDNIEYNTDKATKILKFKCDYSLEEAIKKTVNWYKREGFL